VFRLCASCNQAQSKQLKHARPSTQGPEPSAARLAPRAFCTGGVDLGVTAPDPYDRSAQGFSQETLDHRVGSLGFSS
jgi:hypothetical protein